MLLPSSLSDRLSVHARHALKEARDIARYTRSRTIEPRHLILALMLENGSLSSLLLENIGLKKDALGKLCLKKESARSRAKPHPLPTLAPSTQAIITQAFLIASTHQYPYVGTEHLASAFFQSNDPFLTTLTRTFDIQDEKLASTLESHLHFEQFPHVARLFEIPDFHPSEGKSSGAAPLLSQYALDLALDAKTHPVTLVGREAELERLIQILGRKEKRNALLLGDPGVGKTALVTALAELMATGQAGPLLQGKRIMSLDLALLVAGTSFRGEFETRVKELLKEVRELGNIILFIDEIHTLVGTGNTQGGLDAANILKPSLARGEIQCIGATTLSEYKRHIEKDAALERRFQSILLREPTSEETVAILEAAAPLYTAHHRVNFPQPILREAVTLAVRFLQDRFLPDKALDLIDEAGSLVRRQQDRHATPTPLEALEREHQKLLATKRELIHQGKYDQALALEPSLSQLAQHIATTQVTSRKKDTKDIYQEVTHKDLATVLARMIHVPIERLSTTAPADQLSRVKRALEQSFVGQKIVKESVLRLLTRAATGINHPDRPLGSLLLIGPTGVGKTHLARLLAREFFGEQDALIRIDMSEFMERHSVAQLLGAPAGYVGYGDGGKLTEAVRRHPYSVVLFDEIEKAHPDVANLLLQILDEGRLTDAEGRSVSFRHALIILTSNIGSDLHPHGGGAIGFHHASSHTQEHQEPTREQTEVMRELRETLRPELLSRLDHILVFDRLDKAALIRIAQLELKALAQRLQGQTITLRFSRPIAPYIVQHSSPHPDGARAIKKYIAEHIEPLLADTLLTAPRPATLTLTLRHDILTVERSR